MVEHVGVSRYEIGCHTTEGDRQLVEALHFRIRQAHTVENQSHLLSGIKAAGKLLAFLQPEFKGVGIIPPIFFSAE